MSERTWLTELLPQAMDARAVLLAGPTASGKSALALDLAEEAQSRGRHAVVVNADSMQVYDALAVLTARPGPADRARAPHRLYGHVAAETRYSVGAWLGDAEAALAEAGTKGWLPIFVGGTGLYFKALAEGLAPTPAISSAVRARLADRLAAAGPEALHAHLRERDAPSAASIRPGDSQRLLRALEVLEATGKPLSAWRQARTRPLVAPDACVRIVLAPDRSELYHRIEMRLDRMVGEGALEEVQALLARDLAPDLPALKAIGVRELAACLRNEISLEDAVVRAKTETRRYAKRQTTWFRHQMRDWRRIAV